MEQPRRKYNNPFTLNVLADKTTFVENRGGAVVRVLGSHQCCAWVQSSLVARSNRAYRASRAACLRFRTELDGISSNGEVAFDRTSKTSRGRGLVEFVVSPCPYSERFSAMYCGFPFFSGPDISKLQFNLEGVLKQKLWTKVSSLKERCYKMQG